MTRVFPPMIALSTWNTASWAVLFGRLSVRPRLEISFEDRLQDELERPLDHTVTNCGNRKNADLGAPVFRNLLFPYPRGLIRVVDQFVLNLFQKTLHSAFLNG